MIHRYFLEGQDDYAKDPKSTCPYTEGSEPARSWIAGHNDAWWADKEDEIRGDNGSTTSD